MRTLVVALAVAAPVVAQAEELPIEVEVRVLKVAERELGRIEKQLRTQPGLDGKVITNITLPLQSAIEEDLGRGPLKLHPRAIYDTCLARLRRRESGAAIGRALVDMQRRGDFAKIAAAPTMVESLDAERLRFPDPKPPMKLKQPKRATYQICVAPSGKVDTVTTVESLPGADASIIEQLRKTWLYKPQPAPVCTVRTFLFQS